jgi:hypothetical protein
MIFGIMNYIVSELWFIQNLSKLDCVRSYKLIDTLSNPFLEPTSTEHRVFLAQGINDLSLTVFVPMRLAVTGILVRLVFHFMPVCDVLTSEREFKC